MEHRSIIDWINAAAQLFGARHTALQITALPCRMKDGELEVCLVTSRGTGRWIAPKGWVEADLTHAGTAELEAWEEAGLKGHVEAVTYGSYISSKGNEAEGVFPIRMDVYLMIEPEQHARFPEMGQRKIKWFPALTAAEKASDPGLSDLIRKLHKTGLPR
jgi:8-oxo-dGTP pyrophosphatase MutT (NUDIX family)